MSLVKILHQMIQEGYLFDLREKEQRTNIPVEYFMLHSFLCSLYAWKNIIYLQSRARSIKQVEDMKIYSIHSYALIKEMRKNAPKVPFGYDPYRLVRTYSEIKSCHAWTCSWGSIYREETAYGSTIKTLELNLFCCVWNCGSCFIHKIKTGVSTS